MAGNIDRQGIPPPQAVPGPQQQYDELLADYPELADDVNGLTSWRDGPYDRKSKNYEKQFPGQSPYPFVGER